MSPAFDVPRMRPRSVKRTRLLAILNRDEMRPPLAIVHGPAGDGKSTLLSQWAKSRPWVDEDLVWITLYPDDAGVLPFWSRVAETLVRAGVVPPGFEIDLSAGNFSAMLLGSFRALDRPVTLVLDDYHLVAGDRIDSQIRMLLDRLDGFSVVLGTRAIGRLHSLETAARHGTTYIDTSSLAFSVAESNELVTLGGLEEQEGLGRAIHQATEGWPLASQALIVEAHRDAESPLLHKTTTGSSAFAKEYTQTTLATLPADVREFLMRLSFADEATVVHASDLTGETPERAADLLTFLEHEGIGIWQTRASIDWFRLHPLLREALEAEALAQLGARSIRSVRTALGRQLSATRPLRALELLICVKDWERVERLILMHWVFLSYYNRRAFVALLSEIPPSAMRANPGILNVQLVEDYNDHTAERKRLARRHSIAAAIARGPIEPTVLGALLELSFAGMHRLYGDMPLAMERSERAVEALAAADPADVLDKATVLLPVGTNIALNRFFDRQNVRAVTEMMATDAAAARSGTAGERLLTAGSVAFMHAVNGQLGEARQWAERSAATDPYDGWVGGYLQAPHLIARALVFVNEWNTQGAHDALDLLNVTAPAVEFWPWIAYVRACADAVVLGPGAAHATLSATLVRAERRPRPVPRAQALLTATEAQMLLLSGQPHRAQQLIDDSRVAEEPEVVLVRARLASLSRNDTVAIDLALAVVWGAAESPALRAEGLLTLASSALEAGQPVRAGEAFADALTALHRTGFRLPLLWVGPERIEQLLTLAREQGRVLDESVLDGLPRIAHNERSIAPLTAAETRVMATLRDHKSVASVAEQLFISPETVRFHLKQVYRKLGVNGRDEALTLSLELGLLN